MKIHNLTLLYLSHNVLSKRPVPICKQSAVLNARALNIMLMKDFFYKVQRRMKQFV